MKFYVSFWRLQCTKKLRNSPLCPREWSSITNGSFLRFFLFLLPFRNSIMPNNMFSKNSIIWVFQWNFMFLFEDCNVPKNCEILHFVHWSEAQLFLNGNKKRKNRRKLPFVIELHSRGQSGEFHNFLVHCNLQKKHKISLKNSNYWVFWKSVLWHDTVPKR